MTVARRYPHSRLLIVSIDRLIGSLASIAALAFRDAEPEPVPEPVEPLGWGRNRSRNRNRLKITGSSFGTTDEMRK